MVYQFGNGTLSAFVDVYIRAYCYSRRAIDFINEGDKCDPVERDIGCLKLIPNRSSYDTPEEGLEMVKAALNPFLQSGGTALDTYASRLMSKQYLMLEEEESQCSEPVDIALRIEHAMRKASEEDREKARAAVGKLLVDDPDYKEELHRRFFDAGVSLFYQLASGALSSAVLGGEMESARYEIMRYFIFDGRDPTYLFNPTLLYSPEVALIISQRIYN